MLEIKNICKQYKTGNFVQEALKDVSLNLRDNEFVSILGPSGSGKTTLLNIIGGLDKYDSGDIIIDNVSTKNYKDKDWDSYRSHSIGFIFQSYNLIPHQTLLKNVEIALTISNVPQKERRRRAIDALEKVGLKDHIHKKPNQLSGGQMQRVAIARALVNNPKIILADEPTGALDSKTSVQVMELLKDVAKDRLVVMVTHNPELAKEYSSRIVELKDGVLIKDSNPFNPKKKKNNKVESRNFGKVGMSLFTSMKLSFNNLLSKIKRTTLVSVAGSIGIIGIALIMAISNGANAYIQSMEEQTLSEYPLTISKSTMDLTTMMGLAQNTANIEDNNKINEQQIMTSLFGTVQENNLSKFKEYLENDVPDLQSYVNAVEYGYSIVPYIYSINGESVRQVSPDLVIDSAGLNSLASLFAGQTTTFNSLPADKSLYETKYDIVAGKWPTNPYEMVIILGPGGTLTDLALYNLGLKDATKLEELLQTTQQGGSDGTFSLGEPESWEYDAVIGKEFRLVNSASMYTYDEQMECWVKITEAEAVEAMAKNGDKMTVVGVAKPNAENTTPTITPAIYYPYDLTYELIKKAENSEIVKQQLANMDINVFTGKSFDEENAEFDISKLFNFDQSVFDEIFAFDPGSIDMDMSGFGSINIGDFNPTDYIDVKELAGEFGDITEGTIQKIFEGVKTDISPEKLQLLFEDLYKDFLDSTNNDPTMNIENLGPAISEFFQTDAALTIIQDTVAAHIENSKEVIFSSSEFTSQASKLVTAYITYAEANGLDAADSANVEAFMQTAEAKRILDNMANAAGDAIKGVLETGTFTNDLIANIDNGYKEWAKENNKPVSDEIAKAFVEYLATDRAFKIVQNYAAIMIDMETLEANFEAVAKDVGEKVSAIINQQMSAAVKVLASKLAWQIESAIKTAMTSYMDELKGSFDFSTENLMEIVDANFSVASMKDILTNMMSSSQQTAKSNLSTLGYVELNHPDSITFYPKDFETKGEVIRILDEYNETVKDVNDGKDKITYSDMVGSLMSSVTDIIDIIGYVLIAFVSVSLVVSSIMIGVITYISVLERRKEIGILRAMGASKRNITHVFNCETIITGFLAGLIGVVMTWLILIPTNIIVQHLTGEPNLEGYLPLSTAIILVVLSMTLTTIGGLIPSKSAAKQDPVISLRTE
jgi:ABC-type lipoprotein export system ATPase subunit/ABC-type lipoprotein release transport system permease subunit